MTQKAKRIIKNSLQLLLIALFLIALRSFLYEPFIIPSGSMKSTLLIGDYIIVSKYAYGYSRFSFPFAPPIISAKPRMLYKQPNRGDVVVFRGPRNTAINYIKRVIGLPGDRIQIKDGLLYINNKAMHRVSVDSFVDDANHDKIDRYVETLENGVFYNILQEGRKGEINNTSIFYVPKDHFFVMGDNRDNSTDSRFLSSIGFIPAENLVGRAERVLLSFVISNNGIKIPYKIRLSRTWFNIRPESEQVGNPEIDAALRAAIDET